MTRYIGILALALTAGLSSGNASAQQANAVPLLALSMFQTAESSLDQMGGKLMWTDSATDDSPRVEINGFTSVPYTEHFQGESVSLAKYAYVPDDDGYTVRDNTNYTGCQRCLAVMEVWTALVDAGYTEDEAFEMMMDEDGWLVGGGYKFSGWVYDEERMEMYWVE
jgi:hypothetical protein